MRVGVDRTSTRFTLRSVGQLCLVITMVGAMACGESGVSNPASPSATNGASLTATSEGEGSVTVGDLARQRKTEICHLKKSGDYKLRSVPDSPG